MYQYNSIKNPIENILLKEKGSKFIGFAYPVNSEAEVKRHLEKIYEDHPKATHHCYAYRLGMNGENHRVNDDGEPSGSAGLPIYNQILAHDITNVLVVVVRYYGGVKLGVGGLVKTYKESAKITLDEAEIEVKELETKVEITFGYAYQNLVFTILNKYDAKVIHFETSEDCKILASLKLAQKESISEQLSEMHHLSFQFLD